MEALVTRQMDALQELTLSKDPKTILSATKQLKDLAREFRLDGHENTLRPIVKKILVKYCSEIMLLPKDERGE